MSETKNFEIKNPFTARLSAEEQQIFQESLIDIMPDVEIEDINNRKILVRLIDLAISRGKKIFVQRPEDAETIRQKDNEIGRLKILIDQKDEALEKVNTLYQEAKESLIVIEDELNRQSAAPVIDENQAIITIPPIIQKVIEIEIITAKKKTGKDFNMVDILLNSFWDSVKIGRVSPFRQWNSSELSNLAKQLQNEQK